MMTVRDLSREQLDELKTAYFWGEETQNILSDDVISPEQIPDEIIFNYYDGVTFVDDDFFCSSVEEIPLAIPF